MIASLAVSNYFWLCITIINLSIHPLPNRIKDFQPLLGELLIGSHASILAGHCLQPITTLFQFEMLLKLWCKPKIGFTVKMKHSHRLLEAWV